MDMITPQELQEKRFSKAFMGGYDMGEVDDFLDLISDDYSTLYKDNALLKSKMKVLVDKVEEYRSSEESMRQAIQSARSMANEILEDAKRKSEELGGSAKTHEESELIAIRRELETEQARLREAKLQTAAFVAEMKTLLRTEAELLSGIKNLPTPHASGREEARQAAESAPSAAAFSAAQQSASIPQSPPAVVPAAAQFPVSDLVQDTVKVIEDSVSKIVEGTPDIIPALVPEKAPAFEKDPAPLSGARSEMSPDELFAEIKRETADMFNDLDIPEKPKKPYDPELEETRPKFNFTNLQFGKDYEIK